MIFIFALIECICALIGLALSIQSLIKQKRTQKTEKFKDTRRNIQCGKINDSYITQINMEGFGGSSNEEFLKLIHATKSENVVDLIKELH